MANAEISALVRHAVRCGFISREDSLCAANRLLEAMRLDEYEPAEPASGTLAELLDALILMVSTHDEPAESLLQEAREQQWLEKARAVIAKVTGAQA